MKKMIGAIVMVLIMSISCLVGCNQNVTAGDGEGVVSGGTLLLSVNPKIAVEYNEDGVVTGVTARNDDALAIINSCEDLIGRQTRAVVADLVAAIGKAGYFLKQEDGTQRQITIKLEEGSELPDDEFLDEVISDVQACLATNDWTAPLNVNDDTDDDMDDLEDDEEAEDEDEEADEADDTDDDLNDLEDDEEAEDEDEEADEADDTDDDPDDFEEEDEVEDESEEDEDNMQEE